jgi:uncharacterized protein YdeI (YjbR/CyaY-like superfamily)
LARNHSKSMGVWMRMYRKSSGVASLSNSDALDVALCYGWITGQSRPYDGISWLDRYVPRRPKSIWSKINTERVERLTREGRMKPAGLRQVEEAKRDGRWQSAYTPPSRARLPADFIRALRRVPRAEAFFSTLNRSNVYAVVFRLENAKDAKSRKAKIEQMIRMFERGEKLH